MAVVIAIFSTAVLVNFWRAIFGGQFGSIHVVLGVWFLIVVRALMSRTPWGYAVAVASAGVDALLVLALREQMLFGSVILPMIAAAVLLNAETRRELSA